MIKSFADRDTKRFWETGQSRRIPAAVQRHALDKLQMLNAAETVASLRIPPSNNLERLIGDRAGCWSIRVNKQYRIVFRFEAGGAYDVEFVNYH